MFSGSTIRVTVFTLGINAAAILLIFLQETSENQGQSLSEVMEKHKC